MDMAGPEHAAPGGWRTLQVQALRDGGLRPVQDCVAEESPVAFEFNGISHAVMMATPQDLEDFACGFALSEGIVDTAAQIYDIEVAGGPHGLTLAITLAAECFARLKDVRRSLSGKTGCGLCGTERLEQAVRRPPPLRAAPVFGAAAIARAMGELRARQKLAALTGSTHAAAWCTAAGDITLLREDVGRHNALDKLVGALARARIESAQGFIAITSRASYEMVQKTAAAGIATLAAVSGVTSLAVEVADQAGLTLLGFVRGNDVSVYSHPENFTWKVQ